MLSQKWVHVDSLLRRDVSQKWEQVDLLLRYKYIRFSSLSLFVSGQFRVHNVLKNKRFCLRNKNPVLLVCRVQKRSIQECPTECSIINSREARHLARTGLMDRTDRLDYLLTCAPSKKIGWFARQNFTAQTFQRHFQNHGLGDHGFDFWLYITERNAFSDVINEELGCGNDVPSCFQKNLTSIYSIMMILSEFGDDPRYQRAFNIIILAHHLEWWCGALLDSRHGHFFFHSGGTFKSGR